jgi:hypothetical protein
MPMSTLFQQGEEADRLLLNDHIAEAQNAYRGLINEARRAETMDVFILSKCFLGLIIAEAKHGHFDKVREYAASELGDESVDHVQRLGIFGLEKGMVSKNDFTIFHNLSVFCDDPTKHEAMRQQLQTVALSPWVPPTDEVVVFDKGRSVSQGERAPDSTIRSKRPWWKFW